MKLEDQVVSLELAQKMKKLGFPQESLFYWILEDILVYKTGTGFYDKRGAGMNLHPFVKDKVSAYTVAELGEMLPMSCNSGFAFDSNGKKYLTYWLALTDEEVKFDEKTEADARAKMLIYLKENNLL